MRLAVAEKWIDLRRVFANFTYLTLATAGANLLIFLSNLLLVRTQGPHIHGIVTLAASITIFAYLASDMGLSSLMGIKEVARARLHQTHEDLEGLLARFYSVNIATGLVTFCILLAASNMLSRLFRSEITILLCISSSWVVAITFYKTACMTFNGFEEMGRSALLMLLLEVLKFLTVLLVVITGFAVNRLFFVWTISYAILAAVSLATLSHFLRRKNLTFRLSWVGLLATFSLLRRSILFFAPYFGALAVPYVASAIISRWNVEAEVSYFQATYSLTLVIYLVGLPLSSVLLPAVSRRKNSDEKFEEFRNLAGPIFRYLGFSMSGFLLLYLFKGEWILRLLYHRPEYAHQWPTLALLTGAIAVEVYRTVLDPLFLGSGREREMALIEGLKYVTLIAVGAFWIRHHGAFGAAGAVFAALVVATSARLLLAARLYRIHFWGELWRSAAACGIALGLRLAEVPFGLSIILWLALVMSVQLIRRGDTAFLRKVLERPQAQALVDQAEDSNPQGL